MHDGPPFLDIHLQLVTSINTDECILTMVKIIGTFSYVKIKYTDGIDFLDLIILVS